MSDALKPGFAGVVVKCTLWRWSQEPGRPEGILRREPLEYAGDASGLKRLLDQGWLAVKPKVEI